MGWFWNIAELPEKTLPHAGHLAPVLAQHEFQEAFKNYRDLQFLTRNLQGWSDNLGVFADMLANRRKAFAERLPQVQAQTPQAADLGALRQRHQALAVELEQARTAADGAAFFDARQGELLSRLAACRRDASSRWAAEHRAGASAPSACGCVQGALTWHLAQQYPARVHQAQAGVAGHRQRNSARRDQRDAALAQAQRDEPKRFEAFRRPHHRARQAHPAAACRVSRRLSIEQQATACRNWPWPSCSASRNAWRSTPRRRVLRWRSCTTGPRWPSARQADAPAAVASSAGCWPACWAPAPAAYGTPDDAPDVEDAGRPRGRGGTRRRYQGQRRAGHRRLPQVPRGRAERRRSAPKRCAAWATWRWTAPTRAAPTARRQSGDPDYKAAIARYEDFLKAYPKDPGNDRVLYQLARAREQGGQLEVALADARPPAGRVPEHAVPRRSPVPPRRDAVHACATTRRPKAPTPPCCTATQTTRSASRALYMQGWSLFKQGRLDDGLHSFFGVLDLKLADDAGRDGQDDSLDQLEPRRPRAGRRHLPRQHPEPGQPAGRGQHPAVHRLAAARGLRVPRLPAARRALHQARPQQGRGRHLRRLRRAASRCTRRRRSCRRA